MKKIKLPSPVTLLLGGMGAFWIADFVNPGFNPVAVMILLLIPVLIVEFMYPQPGLEKLLEQLDSYSYGTVGVETKESVSGELVNNKSAVENS